MEQAAELGIFGALKKMTEVFSGWLPILVLVSLIAGVWLYYLLVARHEPQHVTLVSCLRSFLRFESLLWPIVGRVLYLSISVFLILSGLMTTFFVNFFGGIVGMVLLLLIVRILFEMSMMLFGIHGKLMHLQPLSTGTEGGDGLGARPAKGSKPACAAEGGRLRKRRESVRESVRESARENMREISREQDFSVERSSLPDEDALDAQDGLIPRRKPPVSAESLSQKGAAGNDLDLPLFSAKRVDKTEPPMVE
jgi:hypothetical protein